MYGISIFPYMKTHKNSTIHEGKYTNLRPMDSVVGKVASCPSFSGQRSIRQPLEPGFAISSPPRNLPKKETG